MTSGSGSSAGANPTSKPIFQKKIRQQGMLQRRNDPSDRQFLINEAAALLTRLVQVNPFELTMPMVTAAAIAPDAQRGIHHLIRDGRALLDRQVRAFIESMKTNTTLPIHRCQSAYTVLKLRFNSLLDQLDIFADVVGQRSEHDTGVWIAGLDVVARDALRLDGGSFFKIPPLVCYLDRGHGAAIRRTRTRLPGGNENPVAVIKIPRERMVGSGIGSSLVHEVGHQGAALLDLMKSLKPVLETRALQDKRRSEAWKLFDRWISEIISDFWAVAVLGVSASTGLMSVVSLPTYFVFRMPDEDPHPFPWIRVKISLAFGRALYPDPQWDRLEKTWEQLYPPSKTGQKQRDLLGILAETLPDFVRTVLDHKPTALRGKALREVFPTSERQPDQLRRLHQQWSSSPDAILHARPTLAFAVVGQARADNAITPFSENRLLTRLLRQRALMQYQF